MLFGEYERCLDTLPKLGKGRDAITNVTSIAR